MANIEARLPHPTDRGTGVRSVALAAHPLRSPALPAVPAHALPRNCAAARVARIGCTSSSCTATSVEIMSIPRIPHPGSDVDWECGVSGEQQLRY